MEDLWTIKADRKHFLKIFTQTKLTNVLYRLLLYFPNSQEDII